MMAASEGREGAEGARVQVEPGACGFTAELCVYPVCEGGYRISIESRCDAVNRWIAALESLNAHTLLRPEGATRFLAGALDALPHVTCPVPLGILRAVEILAGAALPSVALIRTEASGSKTN